MGQLTYMLSSQQTLWVSFIVIGAPIAVTAKITTKDSQKQDVILDFPMGSTHGLWMGHRWALLSALVPAIFSAVSFQFGARHPKHIQPKRQQQSSN